MSLYYHLNLKICHFCYLHLFHMKVESKNTRVELIKNHSTHSRMAILLDNNHVI